MVSSYYFSYSGVRRDLGGSGSLFFFLSFPLKIPFQSKSCTSWLDCSFRPSAANAVPNDKTIGSMPPRTAAAHQAQAP